MNTVVRRSLELPGSGQRNELVRGERRGNLRPAEGEQRLGLSGRAGARARMYIAAENRLA